MKLKLIPAALTRDKAMIDQLKGIGIEKGRPFNPDEATRNILNVAARGDDG
jgi:hypothetical protein